MSEGEKTSECGDVNTSVTVWFILAGSRGPRRMLSVRGRVRGRGDRDRDRGGDAVRL